MGPLKTGKVILGEDAGMPPNPDGRRAAVYYPRNERDHRVVGPNPLHVSSGPFPVLLYAHAFRALAVTHPVNRDFTSVEAILLHVASYGCVCVAPDLSGPLPGGSTENLSADERAAVLGSYYAYLDSVNATLFGSQLDLQRVVLVGHSAGAAGATHAGRLISGFSHPASISYALIAPMGGGDSGADLHPLLVLGGTLDIDEGADPLKAYTKGGKPKTLVMIPGANHYGYTDICPPDNQCNTIGLFDENGTISRDAQQQTAARYLAAFVRCFALGDRTAQPYLSGERVVEGLGDFGVSGIQVQSEGFRRQQGPPVSPPLEA